MLHNLLTVIVGFIFVYALFSSDREKIYEDDTPKSKRLQIKRKGQWEDF